MSPSSRPIVVRRAVALGGILIALLACLPASVLASTTAATATTLKAIGAASRSPKTAAPKTLPKFSLPASQRLAEANSKSSADKTASTPATSTTIYQPSGSATIHPLGTSTKLPAASAGTLKGRKRRGGSSSTSTIAIILAIVAALAILASLVWALTRLMVFEPPWVLSLRHSLEEASFRVSATFSEFADWVRLGR